MLIVISFPQLSHHYISVSNFILLGLFSKLKNMCNKWKNHFSEMFLSDNVSVVG